MKLTEQQMVPYTASELRGERLLILAPHPDDEVIGCGGLIALHAHDKRQIRVLIASDGTAARDHAGTDYAALRELESVSGLKDLGGPTPKFLRLPDRQLADHQDELKRILKEEIRGFLPDLIAVPSPIEVHPDHLALTRALVDLVQSDDELVGELAVSRVAFYEVSQPIQPNALVDITACAEAKYRAIGRHASQNDIRDYEWFARGLNQYRSMTLFPAARYAEGYHVMEMTRVRTEPWSRLAAEVGGKSPVQVTAETVPISVIIRTRNRERWLRQAVDSVRATQYPASMIVVNDGGAPPADLGVKTTVLEQSKPVGRSEAMNIGVRAAKTPFVAFLDDDDLYYPEHLSTLAAATNASSQAAYYTDALSTFHEPADDGSFRETARLRLFAQEFDRDLLLFDNYIPLPTLLVRRDDFLRVGGFNKAYDLLEDWDFLIRLSQQGSFLRIPRLTCEIRHFRGGDSAILGSPEDSARFREAKLRIWQSYSERLTPDVIATVFEKQKRRINELFGQVVERRGLARHLERDVTRLDREKTLLLEQLQAVHGTLQENEVRFRNTEAQLRGELDGLNLALADSRTTVGKLSEDIQKYLSHVRSLDQSIASKDRAIGEKDQLTASLFSEIKRLNDLLNQIYQSRTWKLHRLVEKLTGRGE
jgi:LmbE family N-acetylglucosaminyl deacetylase/glycosyltransferase involved in cell wall biosynthesis